MTGMNRQHITTLFHAVCLFAAIWMTCVQIYEHLLDNDTSKVDFKTFHDSEEDLYPSISFCFDNPFDPSKIDDLGLNITATSFSNFVAGEIFD